MKRLYGMGYWALLTVLVLGAAAPGARADVSYSSEVLADTPIGYFRLGEAGSAALAADSSGSLKSRNGYYSRGVVSGVQGAINGDPDTAATFDGMTSFVEIAGGTGTAAPNPYGSLTNGYTLEAWVMNAGSLENYSRIISTRVLPPATSGGFGFGIIGATNNVRFTTYGIKDYDSTLTNLPVDGLWHHLVLVLDGTNTANFYLDGAFTDSVANASPGRTSPSNLHIGRNPVPDGNSNPNFSSTGGLFEFWNGSIDEVAIYDYVLGDDRIAAHYMIGIQ